MIILVCHSHYQIRAGEDQVVEAEVALLRAHGHTVVLFTRDNAEVATYSLVRKLAALIRGFRNRKIERELERVIDAVNPDVAHVHNVFPVLSPSIYRVLKRRRIPVVQTIHNFRFLCPNGLFYIRDHVCPRCDMNYGSCVLNRCYRNSSLYSLWYTSIIGWHRFRRTFQNCIDRYIALNGFARDLFVRAGFDAAKFVVKPNASTFALPPVDQPEDRAVFAGRFSWEKGVLTLIKASARVPQLPLTVIGDGPLAPQVRELIATHNLHHITLLPYQPREVVDQHIAHALVTVFPSQCYENCPMTVINSLSAGTPVIGARTGGIPDFVPEGTAGWLFAPGNIDDLAQKLAWVAEHREDVRRMRPAVRAWGQQHFSAEDNCARLTETYRAAIAAVRNGIGNGVGAGSSR